MGFHRAFLGLPGWKVSELSASTSIARVTNMATSAGQMQDMALCILIPRSSAVAKTAILFEPTASLRRALLKTAPQLQMACCIVAPH